MMLRNKTIETDKPARSLAVLTRGLKTVKTLAKFFPADKFSFDKENSNVDTVLCWGRKSSATAAEVFADRHNVPLLRLEDGFLRSFDTGDNCPPLSIVVDSEGIYYDCTSPSSLETLLNSGTNLLKDIDTDVALAMSLVLKHRLSKYNHAPLLDINLLRETDVQRVLVIDQTVGDLSVVLGSADATTFTSMLAAARSENPNAMIYVKTHPEVTSGRKSGYLTNVEDDASTVVLRHAINPISLIEQMDRVYVVTSTMGFEALLAGKCVAVFGIPWYAGWGSTDDRQTCNRRIAKRNKTELFAAAYFHYARYLNTETYELGNIFDVINWLILQRKMFDCFSGKMICVGFRRWKAANIKPLLSLDSKQVTFVANTNAAKAIKPQLGDCLVHWGRDAPSGLMELGEKVGIRVLRMEDGFVRSVGLGSDLIRPLSLVLDEYGIYFDPTQVSNLENLLNTRLFSQDDIFQAQEIQKYVVRHGITKYNLEPREVPTWKSYGRYVVLVPGQVEDDASIRYGCTDVKTNLDLLKAARVAHPSAFIVFKPHPDVNAGNRAGKLSLEDMRRFADYVEVCVSVVNCIQACDEVHTMTSLTGFDALLRGKKVITYGQPFYAGWGLTTDMAKSGLAFTRRKRILTLNELVAGVLIHYPIYWDFDLKGYTSCQSVLFRIVESRDALETSGKLSELRLGYIRRLWRKLSILVAAWCKI